MDTEIVLRKPGDLVLAMDAMLKQMNRKQRKGFLQWVKQKRTQYDFQFPEGYKHKEPVNETITIPATNIVDTNGTVVASVPVSTESPISSESSQVADSTSNQPNGDTSDVGNKPQEVVEAKVPEGN